MKNVLFSHIGDAVKILKLDEGKMLEVSGKKNSTQWGIVILLVPPVINLILAALAFPSGFGVIFSRFLFWPIFVPVISLASVIFFVSFIAQKSFGGKGDNIGFFRTMAYSSLVLWISVIPFLLSLFGIIDAMSVYNLVSIVALAWMFVVAHKMLVSYHKLNRHDVVFALIVGIVSYFVAAAIFGRIFVGRAYRLLY
ncbi:MAG: hypothetical protein ABIH78_02535 [Candidatus Peregrinibacteria bacterium]